MRFLGVRRSSFLGTGESGPKVALLALGALAGALLARQLIVHAIERGEPWLVLSWQAKLLASVQALAPRVVIRLLSWVNRALPEFGGIGARAMEGKESATRFAPSMLTRLNDDAAHLLGQFGPPQIDG